MLSLEIRSQISFRVEELVIIFSKSNGSHEEVYYKRTRYQIDLRDALKPAADSVDAPAITAIANERDYRKVIEKKYDL